MLRGGSLVDDRRLRLAESIESTLQKISGVVLYLISVHVGHHLFGGQIETKECDLVLRRLSFDKIVEKNSESVNDFETPVGCI